MKKTISIVLSLLAVFAVAALVACSSGTQSQSQASKPALTDFGWAKYQVPEGYVQVDDQEDCISISKSEDTDRAHFKIEEPTIMLRVKERNEDYPDAEIFVTKTVELTSNTYLGTVEAGGLTWHIGTVSFKGKEDSVFGYTDVTDDKCISFTAYYLDKDDPDLMTVLDTLELDEANLPDEVQASGPKVTMA